MLGKYPYFYP
jgi:2-oxoglutarate dehydrogenase E2 component (dihydrolipoamide succinyltransferase)